VSANARASVLGVGVDRADYASVVDVILRSAAAREPLKVTCAAVHLVMEARSDPSLARALAGFDLVLPDGQPVRWALAAEAPLLADRVYGPELMRRLCVAAAERSLSVFLYGGTPTSLSALEVGLRRLAPGLVVAGAEAPPFGPSLFDEGERAARRIRDSGAHLCFVGVGCPRQERWIAAFGDRVGLPCLGVGAAFDLWAGTKRMAPPALQRLGLEWAFRFWTEPRTRERYVRHNLRFAVLAALEAADKVVRRRAQR